MTRPTSFTPRTARTLVNVARREEGQQANPVGRGDQVAHQEPPLVKNESGEEIPAYGCMRVTGAEEDSTGRYVVKVNKPNDTKGPFVFNGPRAIEENGKGVFYTGTVKAAYSSGTPAAGETWGPVSDWVCVRYGHPAIMVYGPLSDGKFLIGNTDQRQLMRIGKADSSISYDNSGTISIWSGGADTTESQTGELDWMHGDENISSGKEVATYYFDDEGEHRIIGSECE